MRASTTLVLALALAAPLSPALAAPPAPPVIAGSHFTPDDKVQPIMVVTPTSVTLDGAPVITLVKGELAKADLDEKDVRGVIIPKLARAVAAAGHDYTRPKHPDGQYHMSSASTPFVIQADGTLPYKTMFQLIESAVKGGAQTFAFVATEGGKRALWNVRMPTADEVADEDPTDLGLTISIDGKSIVVWSLSGRAGTLAKPGATIALANRGALAAALAKILKAEKTKPARVLFLPANKTPVAVVYEVADIALGAGIAAVRLSEPME